MTSSMVDYLKRYASRGDDDSGRKEQGDMKKKKQKKKRKVGVDTGNVVNTAASIRGMVIVDDDAPWQKEVKEEVSDVEDEEDAPQVEKDEEVRIMERLKEARERRPLLTIGGDRGGWVTVADKARSEGAEAAAAAAATAAEVEQGSSRPQQQEGGEDGAVAPLPSSSSLGSSPLRHKGRPSSMEITRSSPQKRPGQASGQQTHDERFPPELNMRPDAQGDISPPRRSSSKVSSESARRGTRHDVRQNRDDWGSALPDMIAADKNKPRLLDCSRSCSSSHVSVGGGGEWHAASDGGQMVMTTKQAKRAKDNSSDHSDSHNRKAQRHDSPPPEKSRPALAGIGRDCRRDSLLLRKEVCRHGSVDLSPPRKARLPDCPPDSSPARKEHRHGRQDSPDPSSSPLRRSHRPPPHLIPPSGGRRGREVLPDLSPPRKGRRSHGSPSADSSPTAMIRRDSPADLLPVRRRSRHDSPDLSPGGTRMASRHVSPALPSPSTQSHRHHRHHQASSPDSTPPPRKSLRSSPVAVCPPPAGARLDSPDPDVSPPRRGPGPISSDSDLSPPPRKARGDGGGHNSPALSPPRKGHHVSSPPTSSLPVSRTRCASPDLSPRHTRWRHHDVRDLSLHQKPCGHDSPDLSASKKQTLRGNSADDGSSDLSPSRKGLEGKFSPRSSTSPSPQDLPSPRRTRRCDVPDLSPARKTRHNSPDLSTGGNKDHDNSLRRGSAPSGKRRHDCPPPDFSPPLRKSLLKPPADVSPPRRKTRHDSPDMFPPPRRKARHDSPDGAPLPRRKARHDSPDVSSPQHRGTRHDSPDMSPPRRKAHHDSPDVSPPLREKARPHDSPDMSPPRRTARQVSPDMSPPRRKARHDSPDVLLRCGGKARHDSPNLSPPRRARRGLSDDADAALPPRRGCPDGPTPGMAPTMSGRDSSSSGVRWKRSGWEILPEREKDGQTSLASLKDRGDFLTSTLSAGISGADSRVSGNVKRGRGEGGTWEEGGGKKMSDGAAAGLRKAEEIRVEIEKKKAEDDRRLKSLDASISGRGAATVYRDREGRKVDGTIAVEAMAAAKRESESNKPKGRVGEKPEWGKGLMQRKEMEARVQAEKEERNKPFARYRDDPDLDKALKNAVRWGDPMAHLALKKQRAEELEAPRLDSEFASTSGFCVPQEIPPHSWLKRGLPAAPNRYGIRPGRHWDGRDRSTGFEKNLFKNRSERLALEKEAYLWSVTDM
ncbi:hypothetical protein CBR_g26347 [Chara braunii]|uniref:BUD13 homolog n=1 Tax=Chara braunii TaxID=69332 RepID=A0A388L7R3_CHABU|nr:hypothetical protein CBR_g26347 [Chara braunii]|eukprot:GBG78318.1 hypothetical protein CBR_g26347 [Chara braunii]